MHIVQDENILYRNPLFPLSCIPLGVETLPHGTVQSRCQDSSFDQIHKFRHAFRIIVRGFSFKEIPHIFCKLFCSFMKCFFFSFPFISRNKPSFFKMKQIQVQIIYRQISHIERKIECLCCPRNK